MTEEKIIEFLTCNRDLLYGDESCPQNIIVALLSTPDDFISTLSSLPFRKPKTVQIIAFFIGPIGVDRFYLGDIMLGILKYFTFGGLGIWWIIDICTAKKRCRKYNRMKLIQAIKVPSAATDMIASEEHSKQNIANAINIGKVIAKGIKNIQDSNFIR